MKLFARDLADPRWIYLKGFLFFLILVVSFVCAAFEPVSFWRRVFFLVLLVWSSARLYYFLFYVIERYVDPSYKFSGILGFVSYVVKKWRSHKS